MEWNRPEQMESSSRIVKIADPSKSAPDVAGEVAASLAVASILFNETGEQEEFASILTSSFNNCSHNSYCI